MVLLLCLQYPCHYGSLPLLGLEHPLKEGDMPLLKGKEPPEGMVFLGPLLVSLQVLGSPDPQVHQLLLCHWDQPVQQQGGVLCVPANL